MAAVTLNEISQQNNTNLSEQKKQTGFLKELVSQYRRGMLDAVEKERERTNKEKAEKREKKNPFGPRWKEFTENMKNLNKGFTSFKLPSFLKKVIFGAVVLSAVKLLYQNWETISKTWNDMKPGLVKLKDNVIALKNRFGELGISLGDVAKTIFLTYTAVKVWQMGSMLLRNAGFLISGIKLMSSTLLSAAALMIPGLGGGTRRGGAGPKNAGLFSRLKTGARLMGSRVGVLGRVLLSTAPLLLVGATSLAGAVGLSVTAGGLVVGATAGAIAALGLSALIGAYKAIKETNDQIEKDPEMGIFETSRFFIKSWKKNTLNAVLYPFQWMAQKSLELMGKDVAAEKVGNFNLGEFLFSPTAAEGTLPYYQNKMLTRAFDWFIGRTEKQKDEEIALPFKKRFKLFVTDMANIPGRIRDTARDLLDGMLDKFRMRFKAFTLHIAQIPERLSILARELLNTSTFGLVGSQFGGLTPAAARLKREALDREMAEALGLAEDQQRIEGFSRGRTVRGATTQADRIFERDEALRRSTLEVQLEQLQELVRLRRDFVGTPNQTAIYNYQHPFKAGLSNSMDAVGGFIGSIFGR